MRWLRYRVNRTASGRPASRPSGLQVRHIMREVLVVSETKPLSVFLAMAPERSLIAKRCPGKLCE